jgi:hypothetical protein
LLTTNNPVGSGSFSMDYGIDTVQGVSKPVWSNLGS